MPSLRRFGRFLSLLVVSIPLAVLVAAIVNGSPDPFTMMAFAIPLFLAAILVDAWVVYGRGSASLRDRFS
jgi:hypothetical protein